MPDFELTGKEGRKAEKAFLHLGLPIELGKINYNPGK